MRQNAEGGRSRRIRANKGESIAWRKAGDREIIDLRLDHATTGHVVRGSVRTDMGGTSITQMELEDVEFVIEAAAAKLAVVALARKCLENILEVKTSRNVQRENVR